MGSVGGISPTHEGRVMIDNQAIANLVSPYRRHIWLVAAPKSGSTWLGALLSEVLQWPSVPLLDCYDRREQEVDARMLLKHPNEDIFTPHQHTRATQPTLNIIHQFRIIPVVLVRNIFDSIISLHDHLFTESNIIPLAYFDRSFYEFDRDMQLSAMVDLCVPWYFNFYVSWFNAGRNGLCNLIWVTYEGLREDPVSCVKNVLRFAGVSRPDAEVQQAVANARKRNTRKNVGRTGRGESILTDAHKQRIRHFTRYYPTVDFSMLGL